MRGPIQTGPLSAFLGQAINTLRQSNPCLDAFIDNPEAITLDRAGGSRDRFAPLSVDRIDRKAGSGRIDRKGPSFALNAFWPLMGL